MTRRRKKKPSPEQVKSVTAPIVHHISAEERAEWEFSEDKRLREMGIDPDIDPSTSCA
jgi:hypothetical protein